MPHLSPISARRMASPYSPADQVQQFIINPFTSPAVLLNEKSFYELYNQPVEDLGLPSYEPSMWSAYQVTKCETQIPRAGMSAFSDPKGTLIATSQEKGKMNLGDEENKRDGSDKPEIIHHPAQRQSGNRPPTAHQTYSRDEPTLL